MKRLIIITLLLFAGWQMQAQSDEIPERLLQMEQQVAEGHLSDNEMFRQYNTLMLDYATRDFQKTLFYFDKAVAFAREKKNVAEEANFFTSIGDIYSMLGVKDSVFVYLDKALKLIEGKEHYGAECRLCKARGNAYYDLGDHENALEAYLKSIELNEIDKKQKLAHQQNIDRNLQEEGAILNNIASIYGQLYNADKQIEYLMQSIKIIEDNPSVVFKHEQNTIRNLAVAFLNTGQFDKAFPLIERSYKLAS